VHAYLLPGEGGWTIVDTGLGLPDARDRWAAELAALDGAPVGRIVVTHFHPDHVGAASDLAELTGAPVSQGRVDYAQCALVWGGVAAAVVAIAWFSTAPMRRARWVRREAIPQIKQYADLAQYDSAWMLARRAKEIVPDDSTLASLWVRFARKAVLSSTPEGADVYRASFNDTTRWIALGTTPTACAWPRRRPTMPSTAS